MKRLLLLIILLGVIVYGGYQYYYKVYLSSSATPSLVHTPKLNLTQSPLNLPKLSSVLGAATTMLNQVTDGQAEPLINKTLQNLQNEVKDLPREQLEKVKYQFCQDVIKDYEAQQ